LAVNQEVVPVRARLNSGCPLNKKWKDRLQEDILLIDLDAA
jgi:hypothetical protein